MQMRKHPIRSNCEGRAAFEYPPESWVDHTPEQILATLNLSNVFHSRILKLIIFAET
jgi:hypothetical protein